MTTLPRSGAAALLLLAGACARPPTAPPPAAATRAPAAPEAAGTFGESTPEAEGMDSQPLLDLAEMIRDDPEAPIFSFLVSRHGKLVFELYTSSLSRDDAHYLMSVTKSFTSALVGIAMARHLVRGPEATVAESLPRELFAGEEERARFARLTIKDVLGMSALDASVPPHDKSDDAAARHKGFLGADNRVRFALSQRLLPEPGTSFLYTDLTPYLAVGIVAYASRQTALRFAEENLFRPLGFKNYEWMHEDPSGMDNGAYGLRLRPIDMQRFGVLYLARGLWNGTEIVPASWVDTSFTPWIRSRPDKREPNYGWYWWTMRYGPGWVAHAALGWKGQCIVVIPEQQIVVTMTGYIEDGSEDRLRDRLIEDFVVPSVEHGKRRALVPDPAITTALTRVLAETRAGPRRFGPRAEARMIPSVAPKEAHREVVR